MNVLNITTSTSDQIVNLLQSCLKGELSEKWGESILRFNNSFGKGSIRTISFDWGISLIDCNIELNEDAKVIFQNQNLAPIEFIFISKGYFEYSDNKTKDYTRIEKFQNTIISHQRHARKTFLFPKCEHLTINFIRIDRQKFLLKKNNNISQLNQLLVSLFNDSKGEASFQHGGNFSLKIADEIKLLNDVDVTNGILRSLSIEGRLHIILSLQLLEFQNFEEKMYIPDAISKEDILKIHKLTTYIIEHISETISITILSAESGLSPKKLQLGFKILYSKTVNEYVRQLKLEISKDYLKNTDLSVSEIVYAIGIKSRSYFSKIFFEAYDVLPTEYRKHLKNKNASLR